MSKHNNYHEEIYNKFINEYIAKDGKDRETFIHDEVKGYKPVPHEFPCIEVHFNNNTVYTVIRATETTITWSEGNDFYPEQTGHNK